MKTLVLGASTNPSRYSFTAIEMLRHNQHQVYAVGMRQGEVGDVKIEDQPHAIENLHTVTLYLNAERQKEYYDYLLSLAPKRVLFNPGTENPELEQLLKANGIAFERACTLVLLSTGQY